MATSTEGGHGGTNHAHMLLFWPDVSSGSYGPPAEVKMKEGISSDLRGPASGPASVSRTYLTQPANRTEPELQG